MNLPLGLLVNFGMEKVVDQPNQSLLCALCLSAPLRETKRRRARRRTASGKHCKAEVGVGGERDASGGGPHAEAQRGRERRVED